MTLREAYDTLAAALPAAYCISMDCWNHRHNEPLVIWKVWDASTHFEADTLAGAVGKAMAAHKPQNPEAFAKAEESLEDCPH